MSDILLVIPDATRLGSYSEALRRGWSPDNVGGRAAAD